MKFFSQHFHLFWMNKKLPQRYNPTKANHTVSAIIARCCYLLARHQF